MEREGKVKVDSQFITSSPNRNYPMIENKEKTTEKQTKIKVPYNSSISNVSSNPPKSPDKRHLNRVRQQDREQNKSRTESSQSNGAEYRAPSKLLANELLTVELDSKEYKDDKKTIASPCTKEKLNNSMGVLRASKAAKSIIESDDTFSDKRPRKQNLVEVKEIDDVSANDISEIQLGTIAVLSPS